MLQGFYQLKRNEKLHVCADLLNNDEKGVKRLPCKRFFSYALNLKLLYFRFVVF